MIPGWMLGLGTFGSGTSDIMKLHENDPTTRLLIIRLGEFDFLALDMYA